MSFLYESKYPVNQDTLSKIMNPPSHDGTPFRSVGSKYVEGLEELEQTSNINYGETIFEKILCTIIAEESKKCPYSIKDIKAQVKITESYVGIVLEIQSKLIDLRYDEFAKELILAAILTANKKIALFQD